MAPKRDFYESLGVSRTANREEIQREYRKLARQYHPDVNRDPGVEERFREISEAYEVLSDPDSRQRYDAFGADFRQVPKGVDPQTWARARAGAGRGRGGRSAEAGFGPEADIEDLFGDLFSFSGRGFSGRERRDWGRIRGADQEAELVRRLVALGLIEVDRPRWSPSPGCSGCAPASPSTTPPSVSWSTCSTASQSWSPSCGSRRGPPTPATDTPEADRGSEPPHP